MPDKIAKSSTMEMPSACGDSIFITYCPNNSCFVTKGRSGQCLKCLNEAIGRLASKLIALGYVDVVVEQLEYIKCGNPRPYGNDSNGKQIFIESCPDAIAKAIREMGKVYEGGT